MDLKELKACLKADAERYDTVPNLKDWILRNESWSIYHYVRHMRYLEYYKDKGWLGKIHYLYHFFKYKRLGARLRMVIYPGTVGPGIRIYHAGSYLHIGPNVRMGKNCTIVSGLVFGNRTEKMEEDEVHVGHGCYFGINTTVLGGVAIGDGATIGAHAVVLHDIPSGATAVGVPSKIIKKEAVH